MVCKCFGLSLEEPASGLWPTVTDWPQANPWQAANEFVSADSLDCANKSRSYTFSPERQSSDNANPPGLESPPFDHEQTGSLNTASLHQVEENRSQELFINASSGQGLFGIDGSIDSTYLNNFDTTDPSLDFEPYKPGQSERFCYLCDKVFRYPKDFRRHWKGAHEFERSHKCPFAACPYFTKGFVRKDHKERHMRKVHPESASGVRA